MYFYVKESDSTIIPSRTALNLGEGFKELKANSVDAAKEKHVPAVSVDNEKVSVVVGDVVHPMTEEHLITSIVLETKDGYDIKFLTKDDEPKAEFTASNPVAVYEYCNLHGLWVKEL